jgi:hypothetical protein
MRGAEVATTAIDGDTSTALPAGSDAERFSGRPARVLVIAGLLVTAAAHVPVAVQHMVEVPYLGWAMAAFVVLAAAVAGSVLVEDRPKIWAGALVLNLAGLVVFVISRTAGLPGAGDDRGDWSNPLGVTCVAAELIVVVVTALVLMRRTSRT